MVERVDVFNSMPSDETCGAFVELVVAVQPITSDAAKAMTLSLIPCCFFILIPFNFIAKLKLTLVLVLISVLYFMQTYLFVVLMPQRTNYLARRALPVG